MLNKEKPHDRHSPERSQIQPEYLSIDTYTSRQLSLISIYKTCIINKNSTNIAGEATVMAAFLVSDYNKSNDDNILYLFGSLFKSWASLKATVSVLHFLLLRFSKRVSL